jgi:hypothetical protein
VPEHRNQIKEHVMKSETSEFEDHLCKADKISYFHGHTYAQTIGNREDFVGSALVEYTVSAEVSDVCHRKTRANREMTRRAGEHVPPIDFDALRDELIILPGAAMSAADVICALQKFIRYVEETGMWIGKYQDDYIVEKVDGTLMSDEEL